MRIVAEVTRNWGDAEDMQRPLLSEQFERVIKANEERGFDLESWKFHFIHVPPESGAGPGIVETIIAVFVAEK